MPIVTLNDLELYYEDTGGAQPPVLLIHGSFTRGDEAFAGLVPHLVPHFRVLCPDLRGHGRTRCASLHWDGPMLARDMWAFLDALGIGRAHIVGHSMGGDVAMTCAVLAPERALSLVSIGSGGSANPGLAHYLDKLDRLERGERRAESPFFAKLREQHRDAHLGDWRAFFRTTIASCMKHPDFSDADLARLTMPFLLAHGSLDALVAPEEVVRLERLCPRFRHRALFGAGHAPQNNPTWLPILAVILWDFLDAAGGAPWRIRQATAADYPALAALWRASVVATHDFLAPDDLEAIHKQLAAVYFPGVENLWLAEAAGQVAGFLGANCGDIEMLFVAPAFFGRGLGTALLRHAVAAQERPAPLRVDVNEQNPKARAFYERRGFTVVGRSPRDAEGRPYPLLHLEAREGLR